MHDSAVPPPFGCEQPRFTWTAASQSVKAAACFHHSRDNGGEPSKPTGTHEIMQAFGLKRRDPFICRIVPDLAPAAGSLGQ
ncbi:hypothetical protein JJQ72_11710 [Paenibacillus sp. F411]|uniref:hypothetical protein n=1 Tax=unclassified Paenibacillus TaxID=185978 RepID=UPI0010FD2944|nr:hypothetical protein [Paenibacillus sp. F411]MBO2944636.1 hypothetical protein [Paenibacillus sp. F411]